MEDISIHHTGKGNSKVATVTISNECTIYNVENIQKYLLEKSKTEKIAKVQVKNVSNIDLAGIQLLISLKNALVIKNPEVQMEYEISDDLKKILTNCGLNEIIHN